MENMTVELQGWDVDDANRRRGSRKVDLTIAVLSKRSAVVRLEDLGAVELDLNDLKLGVQSLGEPGDD